MPTPVFGEVRRRSRAHASFSVLYTALILLSLHWAVVLYVNSTYLEQFVSSEAVGVLYTVGSALTILTFLFISRVLRELGNYKLTLSFALAELLVLVGLAFAPSMRVAVPLFIIHQALVPLILFNLDVFTEDLIGNKEHKTGGKRGLILTMMSIAGAIAPLMAGGLLGSGEPRFAFVYLASAALMVPFIYVILKNFKTFKDPKYKEIKVLSTIRHFWEKENLRFVFLAHFLLQLFFAWMVVYVPLYLASVIGMTWSEIGIVLFVALMAYVFLEYPIGEIADRYTGEKEMMAIGFVVIALSTIVIGFLHTPALVPWMVTLFMTRVGASLVETTTESYFFKKTKDSDANVISFFRITRPLAYVIGALLGSFTLLYLPFGSMFVVLGLVMIAGIFFSLMLQDTK